MGSYLCGVSRPLENPIGLANIQVTQYMDAASWIVTRVYVPPEHRRKGIATAMMKEICEQADQQDVKLMLELAPYGEMTKDELREFYMKFGFRSFGGFMKRWPK